ncbi:hypothetical protein A11A3_01732 [Alcanivorax hongdengensis A-11-3]|uniref:SnoaL-like domain-containing protein n=1 Tax=Alcanivorax hongdengensis A-11-3 TaxID=1177179 RepID=L0WFC8_9GAMM|nr:nuclear transport factor 2 family protein [Alcanivorax hongdengensis]EKF75553.1 hypothetical protein A11A3_01732 [Alcanivorax hongdengensis A-11-3]
MKPISLLWLLMSFCLLGGCSSAPRGPYGYTDQYLQADQSAKGAVQPDDATVQAYLALFSPLNEAYIKAHIKQVFAPALYFNDTLSTLRDRDALEQYLIKTSQQLDEMSLTPLRILRDGDSVFIMWKMEARFTLLGTQRLSRTIGISQLRFNDQGQVIFQQDFWDSSQGLDQHLPVIGPMTRWLREH